MLLPVIAVFALFYGASSTPVADQYFDSVLHSVLPYQIRTLSLDPHPLSNFSTDFQAYSFGSYVKGKVNYTNGHLTGLSSARRFSACGGPTYKFGIPTVNCTIVFDNFRTLFAGKLKYGQKPIVNVQGKGNVTTTTVFVEVSAPSQSSPPVLQKFYFVRRGDLHSNITGLDSSLKTFQVQLNRDYESKVGYQLSTAVAQKYQYAFSMAVSQIPLPRM